MLVKFRVLVPSCNLTEFTALLEVSLNVTATAPKCESAAARASGPGGSIDGASTRADVNPQGDMRTPRPVLKEPPKQTRQPGQSVEGSGKPGALLVIFYQKNQKKLN